MLRVVFTVVVPLLMPTALYLVWVWAAQPAQGAAKPRWQSLPWPWLVGAGAVLVALVLLFITVGYGTSGQGTYVPPRWVNGHIVPGHFDRGPEP